MPSPAQAVAADCQRLVAALPEQVLDAERRRTEPASPLTTAYGDPPIEVTCGVVTPPGLAQARSQCFEVNGVGWIAEPAEGGVVFTTLGRRLYLEVVVPAAYAPEANALTDLSGAVHSHNRLVKPCL